MNQLLHQRVKALEQEVHDDLGVLLAQRGHVCVDDQYVSRQHDVAEPDVDRVIEEPAQCGAREDRLDLVPRRVQALVGVAAVVIQLLGEHTGEELGCVVEVRVLLARVHGLLPQVVARGQQQREDVLEHRQPAVAVRQREARRSPSGTGSAGSFGTPAPRRCR